MTDKTTEITRVEPSTVATADILLSPGAMDAIERASNLMATAKSMMPAHLRGSPGDCMAVLMQAAIWKMNPFALAPKTHIVNGQLGYEAQAITAALNSSPKLAGSLSYDFFGDWDKILGKIEWKKGAKGEYATPGWTKEEERGVGVVCSGTLAGEAEPRELRLELRQCYPRNSTLWGLDPQQQICYLASKRWARRYAAAILMGVYDEEELREINITPEPEGPTTVESLMAPVEDKETATADAQDKLLDAVKVAMSAADTLEKLEDTVAQARQLEGDWATAARRHYADCRAALNAKPPAEMPPQDEIKAFQAELAEADKS